MSYILDTNSLIYLTKSGLDTDFFNLWPEKFVIDNHVYYESVERGQIKNQPNARSIQQLLETQEIPIISVDITEVLNIYHDLGESSCSILAQKNGIVITSDIKAIKRFIQNGIKIVQLQDIYFLLFQEKLISKDNFIDTLQKLESVGAISPKLRLFYLNKMEQEEEKNE